MKSLIYFTVFIFLFGCASQYHYHKAGASDYQHKIDNDECKKSALYQIPSIDRDSGNQTLSYSQAIDQDILFTCLRDKGYTVTIK